MSTTRKFILFLTVVILAIAYLATRPSDGKGTHITTVDLSTPIPQQVTVVAPTQPAAVDAPLVVFIEPTNVGSLLVATEQPVIHMRTGITPGSVGSHNTGRTDTRTP